MSGAQTRRGLAKTRRLFMTQTSHVSWSSSVSQVMRLLVLDPMLG